MARLHKTAKPLEIETGDPFEGDYRPAQAEPPSTGQPERVIPDPSNNDDQSAVLAAASPAKPLDRVLFHPHAEEPNIRLQPLQLDFLLRLADALNTTLDLNTLMHRVADLVRAVIDYRIFAILLLNDRTNDLRMRFQTGHTPEVERMRIKLGRGVVGQAAAGRRSILIQDVTQEENYINANPDVQSELAVPLIVKNRVIGVVDIQSEYPSYFTEEHQRLLELTASRMAIAIENARLYTRVARQAQTLAVLNEISREITSILDLDDLLERIGQLLKRVIDFQMFTILLWNDRTEQFEHRFSSRFGERIKREHNVKLGEGVIGSSAELRQPLLVPDVRKDPRYVMANAEVRSELAVPLIYKGKIIGVLDLEHTRVNYYNEDHQTTLSTLAAQVAVSIANARLYQRIHEEEQRLERDLEMAREVQLQLLPSSPLQPRHAEIAAAFLPARSIGGDMYDILDYGRPGNPLYKTNESKRVAIVLGDVSGKAAPAALYAALVSGILRSLAARHLPPAELLSELNDQLQIRKLDAQYVTMLLSVWDDETRSLTIANAGSVQPIIVRRGEDAAVVIDTIGAEGFPLGLFPGSQYEELIIETRPGDMLVFFSDGIVDAANADGDMFGSERLARVLRDQPDACSSAQCAVQAILKAVEEFQDGVAHFDDETLVILRVL
jgi:sigma-B regulation protein RsbU (phosphoserine phosphatase)